MIGYENIQAIVPNAAVNAGSLTLILVVSFAVYNLIQYYYHGYMGGYYEDDENWNDIPVVDWKKENGKWAQYLTKGAYRDYSANPEYSWHWHKLADRTAWVRKTPPPEVTVFMSDGMQEKVNEILSNAPKDTYN